AAPVDAGHRTLLDANPLRGGVIHHDRAVRGRIEQVLDDEPLGERDLRGEVRRAADEIARGETGQLLEQLVAGQHAVARQRLAARQEIVEREPDPDLPAGTASAAVDRKIQAQRLDEVRRELEQRLALAQRFADEAELAVLEIAKAAVNQPRRRARRAARDVV